MVEWKLKGAQVVLTKVCEVDGSMISSHNQEYPFPVTKKNRNVRNSIQICN